MIEYGGRSWTPAQLAALSARAQQRAIDRGHAPWAALGLGSGKGRPLTPGERREVDRVRALARDRKNSRAVARYAALGPVGIARQYAAALCTLRGWRYQLDQLRG